MCPALAGNGAWHVEIMDYDNDKLMILMIIIGVSSVALQNPCAMI
jgi:hypothetical protein